MNLFDQAIQAIDEYNKKDPNSEIEKGNPYPNEYLQSLRQSKWLHNLCPDASEALQIATRSQHIGRWEISRDTYPKNRTGYLQWRTDLGKFHADKTGHLLAMLGFESTFIDRVKELNLKKNIKLDPEAQLLEDVLCLVFLEFQIDDFAKEHDKEKMLNIIRKTWKKMGDKGKTEALKLPYSSHVAALLQEALS